MVVVKYRGETRNIPAQYLAGLKGQDRQKQIKRSYWRKSIFEGTIRPKTKAPEKRSSYVIKFEKKYNKKITDEDWIHKNIITRTGQEKIKDKAMGAYYSGGSRPNQTPSSWAYARLASVIVGGPSRRIDKRSYWRKDIWNKYKK